MYRKIYVLATITTLINVTNSIRPEENGKDLPNNFNQEDYLDRRKRPNSGSYSGSACNFNKRKPIKVYKTDGSGRTFLDIAFVNVGYNYEYNINCGTGGGNYASQNTETGVGYGGHKPGLGGGHKPSFGGHHKPGSGGHHKPGFGGHHSPGVHEEDSENDSDPGQYVGHRPHKPFLSMLFANRPFQNLFGQSSDSSSESHQSGVINNIATSVSGILPSPQEFGQGLGNGIASFVQTLPQIGQSFQSLLPDFGNFQLPQFGGNPAAQNVPKPPTVTPADPADMIYNEDIKPVHEDHDPVTDPYKNRFRPGITNYYSKYGNYAAKIKQEDYNILRRSHYHQEDDRIEARHFDNSRARYLNNPVSKAVSDSERRSIRFPL